MKFKMKKQLIFILLSTFILLFCLISINFISADTISKPTGNEIVPLSRGENRGVLMDPDKMYTLYYLPDGKSASVTYSESFGSYFFGKNNNGNSLIAMSIYYAPWFDQKYTLVKNTQIWFISEKTSLSQKQGVYQFEFKAYGHDWAAVNFKVN